MKRGFFVFLSRPRLLFPPKSYPCCSHGVAMGKGVERRATGTKLWGFGRFLGPFLLRSVRFLVNALPPSDGASCGSELHPTSPSSPSPGLCLRARKSPMS